MIHSKTYRITIVTKIDRPELRGTSYTPCAPGTRAVNTLWHSTHGAAVLEFDSIVAGSWDFASEFAETVRLVQIRYGKSPRTVRRTVSRTRNETRRIWIQRSLQVSAVRRAASRNDNPDWMFPLVWREPYVSDVSI